MSLVFPEGKGSAEKVQERVTRIQQLKEALREETLKNGNVSEKSQFCHQVMYIVSNFALFMLSTDQAQVLNFYFQFRWIEPFILKLET